MVTWRKKRFSSPSGKGRVGRLVKDVLVWGMSVDIGTRMLTRGLGWARAWQRFVDGRGGWELGKQYLISKCMLLSLVLWFPPAHPMPSPKLCEMLLHSLSCALGVWSKACSDAWGPERWAGGGDVRERKRERWLHFTTSGHHSRPVGYLSISRGLSGRVGGKPLVKMIFLHLWKVGTLVILDEIKGRDDLWRLRMWGGASIL